jgi:hypothetical protein
LDQQAFDMPHLQHVFASGNSGSVVCAPYPSGFKNVLGGYQSAKNILCVGNTNSSGAIVATSSRGPVRDGRLKPEITAMGTNVVSTSTGGGYSTLSGTSMAAPAATGGLALLYQRYRQLHGNADPKSALMKALICNGAMDKGNTGPDFRYGFGSMNLLRSVEMLENGQYFTGQATTGTTFTHSINVPANTAQLKVLLYWHDPASSMLSSKALVNDLDLQVKDQASASVLPLVLDSTAPHVNDLSVRGEDHTNNIEQVVINSPEAGTYSINVKGTAIAQNPSQEYFVVYDIVPNSVRLIYPVGGESLSPGETVRIAWDAFGPASAFSLHYSTDGGTSWIAINTNIAAGTQFFNWSVPAVATDNALVRVTKNADGQTSISNVCTIIRVPAVALTTDQCEGYISLRWNAVAGADSYEVLLLKGDEMVPVDTTNALGYVLHGLSRDSVYYVSVRSLINGKGSRRSVAIARQPNTGTCAGSISDNDLKLNAIIAPVSGRKFTSSSLTNATAVTVQVKNSDDAPVAGFIVKYSIDGGATWVAENVAAPIAAGAVYTHTFAATADLSAIGNYHLMAVVINNTTDVRTANDTLRSLIRHIDNLPVNLSNPFLDDVEGAAKQGYVADAIGLAGAERYDFENLTGLGRLRTFLYYKSGVPYSGSNAFTMDVDRYNAGNNHTNRLFGTFNLENYDAAARELRLDFRFNLHGFNFGDSTKVWVRGNDQQPWIEVYDMVANRTSFTKYKPSASIELSDSLFRHGQNFSSSFQVKWGQRSYYSVLDSAGGGLSIDDIRLYEAFNDAQMLSIDTPFTYSCGLSTSVPIKVTMRNGNKNTLNNVPVKYSINGDGWITETISLEGETTRQYTFAAGANLSGAGSYTIKAVVDYPDDNVRLNDTAILTIQNVPLVSTFPYIENFESTSGGWYSEGTKSSWEYGTPASPKINRAASGIKAWKTRLWGNYNDEEISYLYSPCFDIGSMANPALSFSIALDLEDCGTTQCDAARVEYSENGTDWFVLHDTTNTSTNWNNAPGGFYWSVENYTRWHVATARLPKGLNRIRLRFVMSSDPAVNREGIAIDDVHVYDNTKGIYDGASLPAPITQNVSGNGWTHFEADGKLVASLHPANQNLGATNVNVYINSNEVRSTQGQYYHDRNITIKPSNVLTDSATVRFYFLDIEAEALIQATGCNDCSKPGSVYELGVSQYHDYDTSFENGSIHDNNQGLWAFINAGNVTKVPFDKGYYAEFKVKDFSEFWLNNGAMNGTSSLPVKMLTFAVQKSRTENVAVTWAVATESNVSRYEIEVARSTEDVQNGSFAKIGSVESNGSSVATQQYSFTDEEVFKTGVRYYRLKTVNEDGSFTYSITRSVVFDDNVEWKVVPNPSSGNFYFVYRLERGREMKMQVSDVAGRIIRHYTITGNGLIQKQAVDISGKKHAAGIYLLQVHTDGKWRTFKLYKQ